jgi:hypothetical protein
MALDYTVNWSELPLISIAQKTTFNPQFYIAEIIQQVSEKAKIYPFAGQLEKFGMRDHCGQTFQGNITVAIGTNASGSLDAGTKIALTNIKTVAYVGTISEMGNGVKMEKFLLNVSPSDIEGKSVRIALADDIANMLDVKIRNAVYTATTNRMTAGTYLTVGSFVSGTSGQGAGTVSDTGMRMGWETIIRMNTQKQMNNIDVDMPFFIHPYQNEDMFLETTTNKAFTDIAKYTERGITKIFDFEIGKLGQFRIIPTNRVVGTKETHGTNGTQQFAVAFAMVPELSAAMAWALPTEFRYEADYDVDFQRTSALAHYGQGGACRLVDEYTILVKSSVRAAVTAYAIG